MRRRVAWIVGTREAKCVWGGHSASFRCATNEDQGVQARPMTERVVTGGPQQGAPLNIVNLLRTGKRKTVAFQKRDKHQTVVEERCHSC